MPLRTLIVDDEALARSRLRTLLADRVDPAVEVVGDAASATEAAQWLTRAPVDLVLLDIHMPGIDGIELARQLRGRDDPPAIVFVTAHASHAVDAFELDAVDYLTKPVRTERLQQALQKAERYLKERRALQADSANESLLIQERGRAERVPLSEVVYLKSEFKYVTVRTATHSHIYDGSLNEMEERYPDRFVRVHRNALVARAAMRALEKYDDGEDADGWALRLRGVDETVVVSRRQLAAVREALKLK
jgi:two-component system response regulator AlgR